MRTGVGLLLAWQEIRDKAIYPAGQSHPTPVRLLPVALLGLAVVLHVPWPEWCAVAVGSSGVAWAQAPAYEGFGASTPGGSAGDIAHVTNLKDAGPGSFRDAVAQGNRTVVFDVGGPIELVRDVFVKGAFVTIHGFSAPPPGITLRGGGLSIRGDLGAHDVIVRGIRVRGAPRDGIAITSGAYNVVIDHVSIHGSGDGNLDITETAHDVTVSWSIFAAPTFDKNMLIKYNARRISLHHNLFTDSTARNPLVSTDNAATPAPDTTADIRNNLVANWRGGSGTTVESGARVNAINNFYASPASTRNDQEQALFVNPPASMTANLYASGNFSGDPPAFAINHVGGASSPFAASPVATEDTCLAAYRVVAEAGVRPLDALDQQHTGSIGLLSCATVFVKSLYYHALQRAAGEAEVQAWLGALGSSPGASLAWSAVRALFDSPDFRAIAVTPSSYVTALHRAALGQDPDSERLAFYTGEALARFNTLLPFFLGSPVFKAARAQGAPDAMVSHFYQEALGRAPSPAELQSGIQFLTEVDDITPGVAAILNSEEFTRTPRTFAQHVRILYRALLGRDPSASEAASWVDYLAAQLATLSARSGEIAEFEARVAQIFRQG
jgi:hypothetical protein